MNQQRDRCMGCMGEKRAADVCPACSWREVGYASTPSQLPLRSVINGTYMLGRVVGEGGFGITYIGWDQTKQRRVAVKEYFPRTVASRAIGSTAVTPASADLVQDFQYGLQCFSEEGRVLTMFRDHPCIVSFLDFQSANGTGYLVMEFLEGRTLSSYLRERNGRIPCDVALSLTVRVLDGLREVHHHGILHRDISPDNIFLTRSNAVKLLDFGAARFALGERSQTLDIILKRGYAPPEQYRRRGRQGPPTDIYATAATMYRAITSHVPQEALERQEEDKLLPPSRLGIGMAPHVEKALMQALSLEMPDRFKTALEFQNALMNKNVLPDREPEPVARERKPNVYLAYAIGTIWAGLFCLPFFFPARFGLAGTTPTPATTRPSNPVSSTTAPAPTGVAAAKPQVTFGNVEAKIANGTLAADVTFQIRPALGHNGCVVLALVNEDGKYLETAPGKTFQLLKDFESTDASLAISAYISGVVPESATAADPLRKISAQAIVFGNPCSVEDDPVLSKSALIPIN